MIKTLAYGLLYTLVIGVFSACNSDCHDKGNCAPVHYIWDLGEAKNYLWADTGSFWIYKNSKTGELDTQTCVGAITYWVHTQGTTNYAKHITIDYEVLSRRIFSTFNQWEYNDKTNSVNPNAATLENNKIVNRTVAGEGINYPFFFPAKFSYNYGTSNALTTCTNIDTSIIVNGQTYDHVVVFEINMDDIWYPNDHPMATRYPNAFYYWVKSVGLIKRYNKGENYSWDLIDYKIQP